MKKILVLSLAAVFVVFTACSKESGPKHKLSDSLVLIKGGTFTNKNSNLYGKKINIPSFYIGKYEVTQKEWTDVIGSNPSQFKGDNLPVEMISWYEAVEYCNKRSIKEGLKPYYNIDKNNKDSSNKCYSDNIKWMVTMNRDADGYRLPTEAEWEYAAGGGQKSKNYIYSGSNNADDVAWYWKNSGDNYLQGEWNWLSIEGNKNKTKSVGGKKANELGLYDMSGNVREWCYDWYVDPDIGIGLYRAWRGGCWLGDVTGCQSAYRGKFEANGIGPDQGFRVCRSK